MATLQEKRAFNPPDIHRGLTNEIGENNCFLNVTIQALWHLGPFRVELQKFIARIEAGKSNNQRLTPGSLLESMCNLFVQYEFTDQKVLPPNELRESLCQLSGKYEFGKIADANETLDTILHRIHTEQSATCPQMKKCLSHKVFGGLVMEQTICQLCRANSEPTLRDDFITCFQAMELIVEAKEIVRIRNNLIPVAAEEPETKDTRENRSRGVKIPFFGKAKAPEATVATKSTAYQAEHADPPVTGLTSNDFGLLLHKCMEVNERSCPANDEPDRPRDQPVCKGKGKVCFFSLEPPLALALSVGWTQANEDAKTLRDFYAIISDTIQLCDLFSGQGGHEANGPSYTFRGLVCYYGLHYVSIFQEMGHERFLLFDDQKVRVIGDWNAVKEECIKSKYQPVLLLYELNKTSAYMLNTESDDELELVMSEKARTSSRAQKVVIENSTDAKAEEIEVESKTGDSFVLTPSPSAPPAAAPTVAAVMETRSAASTLIDLTADHSSEAKTLIGPFSSPERAKPTEQKTETKAGSVTTVSYPHHIIEAVPIAGQSVNARASIGAYKPTATVHPCSSNASDAALRASVVGGTNTTFSRDMFAPQDDTHMSSLMSAPMVVSPVKAEPKHGSTPSSHSSGSSSSNTSGFHTGSSGSHHPQPHSSGAKHTPPHHHQHPSSLNVFAEMSHSASQSLLQGLHQAPTGGHMVITKWLHRPLRYNAVLSHELLGNGTKSVGMSVAPGPDGKPVVSGFFRHPVTKGMLPAERCGLIQVGDRVVTVNDFEIRENDLDMLTDILRMCDTVTFTLASRSQKNLWYNCPRCTIANMVDQDTEARLKSFNNNKLMNEMKRGALETKGYLMRCAMCRSESMADTSIHD